MSEPGTLAGNERARELIDVFSEGLAQVLESMTDQRPEASWDLVTGAWPALAVQEEILWWQQAFEVIPQPALWVGTPHPTWEDLGGRTLRAAGQDAVDLADARKTWMEVLSQALSSLAQSTGAVIGREVNCGSGTEHPPPPDADEWVRIRLSFDSPLPPLWLHFGSSLLETLATPQSGEEHPVPVSSPVASGPPAGDRRGGYPATLDLLLEVELPVSISFGRTQIPMRDVLKLTTGSIVELNRDVNDLVEVLVNHSLIARGEVVVIDGNYGVRIQEVVSKQDRLGKCAMNWTAILYHPVTIYFLLVTMLVFGGLLYVMLRLDFKALRGHVADRYSSAKDELEALRQAVARLNREIEAGVPAAAPAPNPLRSGLNLTARSNALRMHRRGDSAEQIAAALGLPRQEIELLLKVQQILLANV